MTVAAGLVVGVMAATTPKGRILRHGHPLITSGGLRLQILGPRRLIGHQQVLDGLVFGPTESCLLAGQVRQLGRVVPASSGGCCR